MYLGLVARSDWAAAYKLRNNEWCRLKGSRSASYGGHSGEHPIG